MVLLLFFQFEYIFLQYMIKSKYKVIGVMSGTSLDGLDLAFIEFELNNYWSFKIVKAETIGYSENWRYGCSQRRSALPNGPWPLHRRHSANPHSSNVSRR